MVDFFVKWFGFGWVWEKIDGAKTYIQAAAEMLTGISGMTASAATEASNFAANVHGIGDVWGFIQMLLKNPDSPAIAFLAAWGVFLHGWGVMAAKHAEDKKHAELVQIQKVSGTNLGTVSS